ncbi:hypothetical protein [Streptomyces aureocirculatus]|uniref:hypothetical protein n=1 Tax=Streptomyces aureocirculatus TaxID=67275 RepID=UPI0004CB6131|nr:hypothetical protein [Streptomyces aureocirculatus]
MVLDVLSGPAGMTEEQAVASVRTIGLIGGPAALQRMQAYKDAPQRGVRQEVVNAWPRFDTVEFTESILARALDAMTCSVRMQARPSHIQWPHPCFQWDQSAEGTAPNDS